ncbi:MAG: DNA helicase II / ATP-dependent DNA helicase PcrA, partial [Parcubacteria group bacterium Gr01-1014_48]
MSTFGLVALETFDTLYRKLNSEQKKAVDAIEGPVTVIAGPGTGKTHILTLRIANILRQTDTTPDGILALTFTESAVYSMRKRLVEIIGPSAYRVNIHTFHGFCNEVIRRFPEAFDRIIGSSNISEIDQIQIMEKIVEDTFLTALKPFGDPLYYVRPVLHSIRELKREDYTPQDLAVFIATQEKEFGAINDLYHVKGSHKGKMKGVYTDMLKKIERNKELLTLYEKYEKVLADKRLYDYEDMILETVRVLESNENLLLRLEEQYLYILADEHQDANRSQNRLLELLSSFHENPNLFVVGDGKQAIFRFQGASLDNFLYFRERYRNALVVNLRENYRSSQRILDGAHSLISKSAEFDERLGIPLVSVRGEKGERYSVYSCKNEDDEYRFIAESISAELARGTEPREIAVLYRNNRDVFPLIDVFERNGISYAIFSDQNILADDDISKLVLLLRVVLDLGNAELLTELLFMDFWKLPLLDVYKLLHISLQSKRMLFECLGSRAILARAGILKVDSDAFLALHRKLASWGSMVRNKNAADAAEILIRESWFLPELLRKEGSVERLHKLDAFFKEIKIFAANNPGGKLADFMKTVDLYTTYKIPMNARAGGAFIHGVQLMTAHRSKGLEFDIVYIMGAVEGHWEGARGSDHFHLPTSSGGIDTGDDERRLFYVALTRAKKKVILTYAEEKAGGKKMLPVQFIEEIDEAHRELNAVSVTTVSGINELFAQFAPKKNVHIRIDEKEYLNKLFLDQGFAVTHLNNFLECPWRYFFDNLIRIQRAPSRHQYYGIAIHAVLTHFFDAGRDGEKRTKKDLLSLYKREIAGVPLEANVREEFLRKGTIALGGYYDTYHEFFITPF